MNCPECERLKEQERQANLHFIACDNALIALTDSGPIRELNQTDQDRWTALDAAVFTAHDNLRRIRQRVREHRRAHAGPPPKALPDDGRAEPEGGPLGMLTIYHMSPLKQGTP